MHSGNEIFVHALIIMKFENSKRCTCTDSYRHFDNPFEERKGSKAADKERQGQRTLD